MNNAELLGSYLMSLPEKVQSVSGSRVKAICAYLTSGYDITKKGWREYLGMNRAFITEQQRTIITDFLYFHGIKTGVTRRADKARVVEKLEFLSETNKKRISDFIGWAEKQYDYSQSSIKMKADHMRKFFSYFTEFNNDNCRSFIKTMSADGLSPKTLNLYMITLMQYGKYIKKPVALKKISVPRAFSIENVPTQKEYKSFLENLYRNGSWQVYWIVRILGSTGMRLSEIKQLRWVDILQGDFYPLCKGKKHRVVYFPKQLITDVKSWLNTYPVPIDPKSLFVSKNFTGVPLSVKGLTQKLKKEAEKAQFPKEKAHCHAFRHFFAKQYLSKTKDVIQLAELLGHESVDTTRLYLQKSKFEQKRDINKNVDW